MYGLAIGDHSCSIIVASSFLSPFKRFSKFGLNAETQNGMSKFEMSGYREDATFGFSASYGRIKNKYGFDIAFESSEEYWEKISLGGNIDIESDIKVLDIHASSTDGSHNLEIKADIGETSGKINIIAELPVIEILGKHVSFEYKVMEGSMEIDANLSGDLFKGKLEQDGETYRVSVSTPFSGFETISSRVTYLDTTEKASIDIFMDFNGKVNTFIGYYSHVSYDVSFDIKSSLDKIKKMKVELRNIGNLFEATFGVNDKFYQTHLLLETFDAKFSFFWKDPRNDLVLRYSHTWQDHYRDVNMTVTYNRQLANIHTISENSKIFIETTSPYYHKKVLKLSWKEGAYELHVEHHETEIISVKLDYTILDYWMGKIKFQLRLDYEDFKDLDIETDYSLDGPSKSLDIKVDYGNLFFDMDADWNMTHDTFQGINQWKSSIKKWENAVFQGSYDIKEKTELQFSIEKEGKKDVINVIIKIDSYIPKI